MKLDQVKCIDDKAWVTYSQIHKSLMMTKITRKEKQGKLIETSNPSYRSGESKSPPKKKKLNNATSFLNKGLAAVGIKSPKSSNVPTSPKQQYEVIVYYEPVTTLLKHDHAKVGNVIKLKVEPRGLFVIACFQNGSISVYSTEKKNKVFHTNAQPDAFWN